MYMREDPFSEESLQRQLIERSVPYESPQQRVAGYSRSKPGKPKSTPYKRSAVLRSSQLDNFQPWFERMAGIAILLASFAGTIMLFNGGWSWRPSLGALLGGAAVQWLCTVVEWLYRRRRLSLPYLTALAFDAGTSVAGYSFIAAAPLAKVLPSLGVTLRGIDILIWGVMLLIAVFIAMLPESVLIE